MAREFQGTGWEFPVGTDHNGDIRLTTGNDDIETAIRIIVGTPKGERVMRPDFGCDIHDHVFAAVDATTLNLVETDVHEALVKWEPRIDIGDVEATYGVDPDRILVSIDYRVRTTNSRSNLVYPFYLGEG